MSCASRTRAYLPSLQPLPETLCRRSLSLTMALPEPNGTTLPSAREPVGDVERDEFTPSAIGVKSVHVPGKAPWRLVSLFLDIVIYSDLFMQHCAEAPLVKVASHIWH